MTKKIYLFIYCISFSNVLLQGECFLCEEINEKNRNLPPPKFEYYEDYLEDLKNQKEVEDKLGNISFEDSE